jgi:hypothetical protein
MRKNGVRRRELGHRLVACAFLDAGLDKNQVNHKNGLKSDNRIENLEWCTQSENNKHSYQVLGRKVSIIRLKGGDHPLAKKVVGCNMNNGIFREYDSVNEVSFDGFSPDSVRLCAKGKQSEYKNHIWFWG